MCAILHSTSFPEMRKCVPAMTCETTFTVSVYTVYFECIDDPPEFNEISNDI